MKEQNFVIQCKSSKVRVSLVPHDGWKGLHSADILNRRGIKIGSVSVQGRGNYLSHTLNTWVTKTQTHSTLRKAVTRVVVSWMDYNSVM